MHMPVQEVAAAALVTILHRTVQVRAHGAVRVTVHGKVHVTYVHRHLRDSVSRGQMHQLAWQGIGSVTVHVTVHV